MSRGTRVGLADCVRAHGVSPAALSDERLTEERDGSHGRGVARVSFNVSRCVALRFIGRRIYVNVG